MRGPDRHGLRRQWPATDFCTISVSLKADLAELHGWRIVRPGSSNRWAEPQITRRLGNSFITDVTRGGRQTNAARLAPRRFVDLFLVSDGETARRIFRDENGVAHLAADLRFLALTSFQSFSRPSFSSGSSSRISLRRQSFSVSRARLRPPGNIHSRSRLLLTNRTRPRFAANKFRCLCHYVPPDTIA